MKNFLSVIAAFYALSAFGGGTGGSTPPSFEMLAAKMDSNGGASAAGLFSDEAGTIGLGISGQLNSIIVLHSTTERDVQQDSNVVPVSEADLATLQEKKSVGAIQIDVTSIGDKAGTANESRSYTVEDGEVTGELILVEANPIPIAR